MGKKAIHRFGRIGRSTLKAALAHDLYVPVSISDIKDLETLSVLFAVDTNYGRWNEPAAAASGPLHGVMGVLEDEFASCRIVGDPLSSLIDLPLVQVLDGRMVSVAAWYDNEMAYATRLAETARSLAEA